MATLNNYPAICYVNQALNRTITVSSANASYPGSNLALSGMTPVWRSANAALTSVTVDVDLGSSKDIDVIALLGFNGQDSATRTPTLSDNSNFSSPEYAPGSGNAYDTTYAPLLTDTPIVGRHLIVLPGQTYNSRYVRLSLSDSGNPDNYLKGSVYWVGPVWQPPVGMDISSEPVFSLVGVPGAQRAITGWKLSMLGLTDSDARKLQSILSVKLATGRFLFVPYPLRTETYLHEAVYCVRVGEIRRSIMPRAQAHWQVDLEFRGVED